MNNIQIILIVLFFVSYSGLSKKYNISIPPTTLKGTNWTSLFYHYCNNYHFDTDSTGFSEDGQVAWSCPVDTTALGISENEILYSDPQKFKYDISDTILTIEYLTWKPNNNVYKRIFFYRPQYDDWISEYEYAYGKECLKKGKRKEKFDN